MFDFLLQAIEKLGRKYEEIDNAMFFGTNHLDIYALLPYILDFYLEKQSQKVLLISFDDYIGSLLSISRNSFFKLHTAYEKQDLVYANIGEIAIRDDMPLELPFLTNPSQLYKEDNTTIDTEHKSLNEILEQLFDKALEAGIKNIVVTGIESYLVCLEQPELKSAVLALSEFIDRVKSTKTHRITFFSNRECASNEVSRFLLKLSGEAHFRCFMVENEGGYSQLITGHLLLDYINTEERKSHKKKLHYKVNEKTVDFFEKLTFSS